MSKIAIAAGVLAAGILAAAPALATDLKDAKTADLSTSSAMVNWSGIWAGGHIGWGNANHEVDVDAGGVNLLNFDGINSHGAIYGLDGGADISRNGWVFGLVGGYDWSDMETELSVFNGAFGCSLKNEGQWYAGGRVGRVISSRVMVYGLLAYTEAEYELGCDGLGERPSQTYSGIRAGIGGEYALGDGLFAKGQYTHDFFEDQDWVNQGGIRVTDSLDQDVVTLGFFYKFGGALPGLN
jgi:hypothetical protein